MPETGAGRLLEAIDVPAGAGRAWQVRRGQEVRVVAVEGPQAADLVARLGPGPLNHAARTPLRPTNG